MKNNVLGALVIFFVTVACLLMIDDITSNNLDQPNFEEVEVSLTEKNSTDLATNDNLEE